MNNELKLHESWKEYAEEVYKNIIPRGDLIEGYHAGASIFQQQAIKELEEEMERNSTSTSPKVVTSCYYGLELALKIIKNLKAPKAQ